MSEIKLLTTMTGQTRLKSAARCKEWTGKTIYLNFSSIFGDFFLKFFEVMKKSQELNRKLK